MKGETVIPALEGSWEKQQRAAALPRRFAKEVKSRNKFDRAGAVFSNFCSSGMDCAASSADRREPIFQIDLDRTRFLDTLAEICHKIGWRGDAQKLEPARRLGQETTMTLKWCANRLHMGVTGSFANRFREGTKKAIMFACAHPTLRPPYDDFGQCELDSTTAHKIRQSARRRRADCASISYPASRAGRH